MPGFREFMSCPGVAGKVTILEASRLQTYGIAAGILLVLALVAPLFTRGGLTILILVALAVAGISVIRGIVRREAWATS